MSDLSSRDKENRRIYSAIGEFIFRHRLDPSPANYMLVHMLVTKSSPAAVLAIEKATSDGLRLTQQQADEIMADVEAPSRADPLSSITDEAIKAAAREMEAFASLVDDTRAETRSYGRDLEASASELTAMDSSKSVADIIRFTGAMIDRTRAAERRLQQATGEARSLRQKLECAKEEARSDALTSLPNRRAFEMEYDALSEADLPVCLALCDVDRFKSINDSHGHAVGDRVLRALAGALRDSCGDHMVARLGGEEFTILLKGLDALEAYALVERARRTISERRFKVRETDSPIGTVSFSAGVAVVGPGEPLEAALQRADALMYRAKQNGRNRIQVDDKVSTLRELEPQ